MVTWVGCQWLVTSWLVVGFAGFLGMGLVPSGSDIMLALAPGIGGWRCLVGAGAGSGCVGERVLGRVFSADVEDVLLGCAHKELDCLWDICQADKYPAH